MKNKLWPILQKIFPVIGLLIIVAIFSIICGDKLWTRNNLLNIINIMIPVCIGGSGMIFVAAQGSTDMSMGALLAATATLAGMASIRLGLAGFIVVALSTGLLLGMFNGFILAKFKVSSLMVTLAMSIMLRAIVSYLTNGQAIFVNSDILALNRPAVKFPVFFITMLVMWLLFKYTKAGFFSRCIGENEVVGKFAGIPVKRYKIIAFAFSGLMGGVVGMFTVGNVGGVSPTMGNFFELQVMTAMFVGGIPVLGGAESKFYKLILGSLMLTFLQNGLTLSRVGSEVSELIQGVILLSVVFFGIFVKAKHYKSELAKDA
ncbi:MAG: ABC transporter permease [Lawsonibacter sp.]